MGMYLLIAFIAIPLVEIGVLIQVGGIIGVVPALAIIVITAFTGAYMVRSQGLATARSAPKPRCLGARFRWPKSSMVCVCLRLDYC